ncbi:MAG TPA: hypothetical protein QGH10_25900, partial [Armatimonadota bacterium]|nr:hypothetical protein [Armatimonadota bacterium]
MMCRLRAPFCWSCLLVAALFSKAAGQDAQATLHLSDPIETPLGTLPEDGFDSLKFSRDQLYVAWLDGTKWANRVSFNGKPGRAYRDIDDGKIAVSPDGRRVAYVADKGDMEVLVLDGREGRPYRYISGFSFSPDSRRHAYCAWETGAGNYAVVDGARHGPYDVMDGGSRVDPPHHRMYGAPQFTRDSRHVIYAAARTVQGRLQWRVVIDGKEGPTFDLGDSRNQVAIHVAALSPEPRFAHRAKKGEKWITVHNGVEGPEHDLVEWLAISPDGTRLAYFAKNGDE